MADANKYRGAMEVWNSLRMSASRWAHDDYALLEQHQPLAGMEIVFCRGCNGLPWEECPVIDRTAAALLGDTHEARSILDQAMHRVIGLRIDSSLDRAAGLLPEDEAMPTQPLTDGAKGSTRAFPPGPTGRWLARMAKRIEAARIAPCKRRHDWGLSIGMYPGARRAPASVSVLCRRCGRTGTLDELHDGLMRVPWPKLEPQRPTFADGWKFVFSVGPYGSQLERGRPLTPWLPSERAFSNDLTEYTARGTGADRSMFRSAPRVADLEDGAQQDEQCTDD